jgi:hypothetical protein
MPDYTNGTNITSIKKPDVGQTTGPTWATYLNESLDAIDEHDHSTGQGSQITPAGLNINADLEVNGNDVTEVRTVALQSTTDTTTADTRAIYSTSTGDLYYRDSTGAEIRLTQSGSPAGGGGSGISGLGDSGSSAAFVDATDTFVWTHDGTNYAKNTTSDLTLYKFNDVSNAATVKFTGSSSITLTLPSTASSTLLSNNVSLASNIQLTTTGANDVTITSGQDVDLVSARDITLTTAGTGDVDITVPTGRNVTLTIGAATATFTDDGSGSMTLALS